MFSFIKFYLLECVGFLNAANGRKSLLDLFPDVHTIIDSGVFEANIWTLQTQPFNCQTAVYFDNHPNSVM